MRFSIHFTPWLFPFGCVAVIIGRFYAVVAAADVPANSTNSTTALLSEALSSAGSPKDIIYWKLRKVGGTSFCNIFHRYVQLTEKIDFEPNHAYNSDHVACHHRFESIHLKHFNRPEVQQIITMREPMSALASHYYYYAGSLFQCLDRCTPRQWRRDSCKLQFGVDFAAISALPGNDACPFNASNGYNISQYLMPGVKIRLGFSMPTMEEAVSLGEYYIRTYLLEWTPFHFWTEDDKVLRREFLGLLEEARAGKRLFTVTIFDNFTESLALIQRKLGLPPYAMLAPAVLRANSIEHHPSAADWDPKIVAYLREQMEVSGVNAVYRAAKEYFEQDVEKSFPEGDAAFRAEVDLLDKARAYHAEYLTGEEHDLHGSLDEDLYVRYAEFQEMVSRESETAAELGM